MHMSWWLMGVCSRIISLQFTRFSKVWGPHPPSFLFHEKHHGGKVWLGTEQRIWQKEKAFFVCSQQICHHCPSFSSPSLTEGGANFGDAWRKAWKKKGEHRKRLWKSVYLGPHCSGTKSGTLDLLSHVRCISYLQTTEWCHSLCFVEGCTVFLTRINYCSLAQISSVSI